MNIKGVDVRIKTEQREGYFAARTMPFAITAYGGTEDKAEKRAIMGVEFYLKFNPNPK